MSIEECYRAAGILPIAQTARNETLVLLGTEPTQLGLRWLAFGGKRELIDASPTATALREFHEESGRLYDDDPLFFGPRFYDFQAKYCLYLGWVPYAQELPSFTDEQAAADPTLNKRTLRWFPLEELLEGDAFELGGPFPIKPWFQRLLQRERYAIRRAVASSAKPQQVE